MRAFATAYPEAVIVQQLAAQIPWFHNNTKCLFRMLAGNNNFHYYNNVHQTVKEAF